MTAEAGQVDRRYHIAGYGRLGIEQGDGSYGAGFSLYSSAWPMLDTYPGHDFQSGLFGTWMYPDSEDPEIEGVEVLRSARHERESSPPGLVSPGFDQVARGQRSGRPATR